MLTEKVNEILAEHQNRDNAFWLIGRDIKRQWFMESITLEVKFVEDETPAQKKQAMKPFTIGGLPVVEDFKLAPDHIEFVQVGA